MTIASLNGRILLNKLPPKSAHYGDSGYDGAPNDYPEYTIILSVERGDAIIVL